MIYLYKLPESPGVFVFCAVLQSVVNSFYRDRLNRPGVGDDKPKSLGMYAG